MQIYGPVLLLLLLPAILPPGVVAVLKPLAVQDIDVHGESTYPTSRKALFNALTGCIVVIYVLAASRSVTDLHLQLIAVPAELLHKSILSPPPSRTRRAKMCEFLGIIIVALLLHERGPATACKLWLGPIMHSSACHNTSTLAGFHYAFLVFTAVRDAYEYRNGPV